MIGAQEIAALGERQEFGEAPPRLWKEPAHAVEKPFELRRAAEKNPAQDESAAALGKCIAVGERERAPPRSAEQDPAIDPEREAKALDVLHEMRGRVVADLGQRQRTAGSPLV